MSGIECINLLAFIQFITVVDFGLYYLDDWENKLVEIYNQYQEKLRVSTQAILVHAKDILKESLKSDNDECKIISAYLDKVYRRLKYRTYDFNLEGCGFIGFYAGLYGVLCLIVIGLFGSRYEAYAKNYMLVTSQVVLVIQLFIAWYNYWADCTKYSRDLWSNIRFCILITLFIVGLVKFDWTYKCFSEFELPFVITSLIVLLFPFILFVGHIIVSRIMLKILILKYKYYTRKVEKCLKQDPPQE
ncbi:hypothetical protein [uncultured Bacteroides sp.]|uniref:hypothetical protein n=1 Tax=uncultured Bacteroides sp. TaxID=162156 RepID=UPI002611773B|nr:hypothetical protein [uncultured Bacteroides sp.]